MRRFLLRTVPDAKGMIRLVGKDYRYLVAVLRKRVGDIIPVAMIDGSDARLELVSLEAGTAICRACPPSIFQTVVPMAQPNGVDASDAIRRDVIQPLPPLVLLQALPKGSKMDLIIRQATEAGVALILPFIGDFSVARPADATDRAAKKERWERIVKEARQQSGSRTATEIAPVATLAAAIDLWRRFPAAGATRAALFFHQDPLAQGTFHGYLNGRLDAVALAVGPEGGFSLGETTVFLEAGFKPLLLGSTVLRTETAAIFSIAAVQVVLMEQKTWNIESVRQPSNDSAY